MFSIGVSRADFVSHRFTKMYFKHVLFEDTLFDECYFEDVTSTDTYFKNCTIESTIFYNTGKSADRVRWSRTKLLSLGVERYSQM